MNDPLCSLRSDLKRCGIYPNRSRGQNFLISSDVRKNIIKYADLKSDDFVIEIGPGTGVMSWRMAPVVRKLVLVEIESAFVSLLREKFASSEVQIVEADAVQWLKNFFSSAIREREIKIISNLPYGISSPVLMTMSMYSELIDRAVLLLQKEVAERLVAQPGSRNRGVLTIMVQCRYTVQTALAVGPEKFWPCPAVDSSVVILTPRKFPPEIDFQGFGKFIRGIFAHKRKTISNNLKFLLGQERIRERLTAMEIDPGCRPEKLAEEQLVRMYREFQSEVFTKS